jgi:hypothetical protein
MRAAQKRHQAAAQQYQQHAQTAQAQQAYAPQQAYAQQTAAAPAPPPIFYLSPSFAHAIGFPSSLPRLCLELGVTPDAFKIVPLTPALDEAALAALPRGPGALHSDEAAASAAGSASASASPAQPQSQSHPQSPSAQPNPYLTSQLDPQSLHAEMSSDFAAGRTLPCGLFLMQGNRVGLDQPYECDNVALLAGIAARFGVAVHAEGSALFIPDAAPSAQAQQQQGGSAPPSSVLFQGVDSVLLFPGDVGGPSALSLFFCTALLPGARLRGCIGASLLLALPC